MRRRQLRRTLGAFPALLLRDGVWHEGTAHTRPDAIHWYKDASVRPGSCLRLGRRRLDMQRLAPESALTRSVRDSGGPERHGWVVVRFSSPDLVYDEFLAMDFAASAGVCAWIEALGVVGLGDWRE
ncbi:DUF2550 family protein [Falsarthrobacter nasiphocae]|uniref:DUF2550 family protein n=1 Tax=Falsarthrobacter nasiphocae TaxID=189863 RepID=UPI00286AF44A|nr:DUF2550 family protein [Falsarthrobacter nasiphocae]